MAKRQIDILVSLVGLIMLIPVLAATALTVLLSMGRPIFFRQVRPGKDNQLFTIYKFRTMRNGPGSAPGLCQKSISVATATIKRVDMRLGQALRALLRCEAATASVGRSGSSMTCTTWTTHH